MAPAYRANSVSLAQLREEAFHLLIIHYLDISYNEERAAKAT